MRNLLIGYSTGFGSIKNLFEISRYESMSTTEITKPLTSKIHEKITQPNLIIL